MLCKVKIPGGKLNGEHSAVGKQSRNQSTNLLHCLLAFKGTFIVYLYLGSSLCRNSILIIDKFMFDAHSSRNEFKSRITGCIPIESRLFGDLSGDISRSKQRRCSNITNQVCFFGKGCKMCFLMSKAS